MHNSLLNKVTFTWLPWAMLLLLPITFFGFLPSYFGKLHTALPLAHHIHAGIMLLWLFMAIAQPFLIKYNKISFHKTIGKASYALMPFIIASGYLILRFSYHRALSGEEVGPPGYFAEDYPLHIKAAEFVVIGFVYWLWLIIYYVFGVYYRKNTLAHATYMTAAAFTILGPAGDRFVGHVCDALDLPYNWLAENFIFILVFIYFASLLRIHHKRKLNSKPVITTLIIHITGILLFYLLPYLAWWNRICSQIF
ncbi:MAG TPA: hypothetical protein PKC24_13235 [Cyclobacteriaceae bacterium]|nr:hypothetical protein [Cyclobacteriaceae bacterium]